MRKTVCLNPEEAFHIHTWRCEHAGDEREDAYIRTAMYLSAKQITFTDHAPFQGDSFRGRMKMADLPEYIKTLSELKAKYQGKIEVRIGLEAEYLPGFRAYYEKLREDERIEYLLLGQHFYELAPGAYSFSMKEKSGQANSIIQAELVGVESGYFSGVAHPDRGYRYLKPGETADVGLAKELVVAAREHHIPLERNLSSMEIGQYYPDMFWKHCPDDYLVGLDAHSVSEMARRYHEAAFWNEIGE